MTTPLRHSGDSANIAYYGEAGRERPGRIWCEVLRSVIHRVDGELQAKRIPDYYVTVYRTGEGEIARTTYTPRTKPRAQRLPDRTVTRLVRDVLNAR